MRMKAPLPLLALLALAGAAVAQEGRLPPANPLPPPSGEESQVFAPVQAAFAALENGDAAALLRVVYPDGRITAVGTLPTGASGVRSESFTAYAARMSAGRGFRERISSPAIEIDGDVAMIWAPFTIEMGGRIVSCGYDHFDLVREQGGWKIMNLTFSTRTSGCPGQ